MEQQAVTANRAGFKTPTLVDFGHLGARPVSFSRFLNNLPCRMRAGARVKRNWLRILMIAAAGRLGAQDVPATQRWNIYFQATSIGQYHGRFPAPYAGHSSLINHPEGEASITSTFFLGV